MPKRIFSAFLSAVMTCAALSGCGADTTDDSGVAAAGGAASDTAAVETTVASADEVTAPTDDGSTDDTAASDSATSDEAIEIQWNYSELKRKSDDVSQSFDSIITSSKFRGTVYVKVGTALEYIGTNGFADKDTHTSNSLSTRCRAASLTKQFTAAAVMKLKEDGKINLDDTIDKYFPDCKYGEKITVKNLLTMTAGLKDYLNVDGDSDTTPYNESELEYEVSEDNSKEENKQAIMDWLFEQELNFEPDEKFMYSNSAYFLLGDIIEQASGMEYEDYVTENLLKPAGMVNSGFTDNGDIAVGYQDMNDNEWALCDGVGYSAAGLISSVSDLLKWVDALTSGEIISEESLEEMTTAYKGGYGYGLFVSDDGVVSHTGKIDKYNAELAFSTDESYIYIALSNYTNSDPAALLAKFNAVLSEYTS